MTSAAILSIWLIVALPGYTWIRRLNHESACGWLGTLSLSYVHSFAMFTPLALGCYFFNLSIAVLGLGIVALILISVIVLIRQKAWKSLAWHCEFIELLGVSIILVDLVLAARTGGRLSGDAMYHIARTRMILDHGANNWEPFYYPHHFAYIYHSNLYHALLAAIAAASRIDVLDVWQDTLLWAKLITASGIYYLGWSVFRTKSCGWLSTILYIMWWGHENFQLVPNKIAPVWLLSMAIALTLRCIRDHAPRDLITLACVCLILPQFHIMYSLFYSVLVAPVLLIDVLLNRWSTKRWSLFLCLAFGTSFFSVPFLVVSKYVGASSETAYSALKEHSSHSPAKRSVSIARKPRPKRSQSMSWVINVGKNYIMLNPARYLTPYTWMGWLAPLFILGLVTPHRRSVFIVMMIMLSACLIMFVPAICTMFIEVTKVRAWVIRRYAFVHVIGFIGIAPGVMISLFGKWSERWSVLFLLTMVCVVLGLHHGQWPQAHAKISWKDYVDRATLPQVVRSSALLLLKAKRQFLLQHIPPGQTVVTSKSLAPEFVMLHNMYVVVSSHSSARSSDMSQRNLDLRILWNRNSTWHEREPILRNYGIRHIVLRRREDVKQYYRYRKYAQKKFERLHLVIMSLDI